MPKRTLLQLYVRTLSHRLYFAFYTHFRSHFRADIFRIVHEAFVADNARLITCKILTQIQLWSVIFQALSHCITIANIKWVYIS